MIFGAKIIGLGYRMGAGKDSVADVLVRDHGFVKMSFADALKEAVSCIFGWSRELLDDQKFKATEDPFWGMTPRAVLQRVGTDAMRNRIRSDVWVKALELRIRNYSNSQRTEPRVVITDMRFPNEVEAVKAWGGKAVQVIRPNNMLGLAVEGSASHASEHALDDYTGWDYTLYNDGTLESLDTKVIEIL